MSLREEERVSRPGEDQNGVSRMKSPRVLVTAGATWIRVDEVRVLTNVFTGRTGIGIARYLREQGARVKLLLNPSRVSPREYEGIPADRYFYYEELACLLEKELSGGEYDALIHTAAVSDYRIDEPLAGKMPSGRQELRLRLVPAAKLIRGLKGRFSGVKVIQCKLEMRADSLCERAYESLQVNGSDYVIANALDQLKQDYRAYLIDRRKNIVTVNSREELACCLYRCIVE
ncbi:MAG: hypothetical protein GF333_00105 [Candidatus Omnitrophica bacterium]|nr:hypothetical protein [Candidatus Omnitrophota bacterium]